VTQGVFILDTMAGRLCRPRTKKELRITIKERPETVILERTAAPALDPNVEYEGKITEMPEGETVYVVGPNPYNSRKWFANLTRKGNTFQFE
jgi:hypothetical protein